MNRILVPVDFSPSSESSLQYAHELSQQLGMRISLLHCYSAKEFNRVYDFEAKEYSIGITEMLADFYTRHIGGQVEQTDLLARKGSLTDTIALISSNFRLLVLGSKNVNSKLKRWMESRSSYVALAAKCPVIIKPASAKFSTWNTVWHIQRTESELKTLGPHLRRLKINPDLVTTKSLQQTTFTSNVWKLVVTASNKPEEELHAAILAAKEGEKIDLIILVSHNKDFFRKFIQDEAIQIMFLFDIPVLIIQARPNT